MAHICRRCEGTGKENMRDSTGVTIACKGCKGKGEYKRGQRPVSIYSREFNAWLKSHSTNTRINTNNKGWGRK